MGDDSRTKGLGTVAVRVGWKLFVPVVLFARVMLFDASCHLYHLSFGGFTSLFLFVLTPMDDVDMWRGSERLCGVL